MTRVYKGFGETLPDKLAERQLALQRLMKRQAEKEEELHEKLKKRYVESNAETIGGQKNQE